MKTTISRKGQVTLPKAIREAIGVATGARLNIRLGREGEVILSKDVEPGFYGKFLGRCAEQTPFASGDEAVRVLRVEESPGTYRAKKVAK